MKKYKLVLPLMMAFLVSGCSNVDLKTGKSNGKGIVDCAYLKVFTSSGSNTFQYSQFEAKVNTFHSASGKVIFSDVAPYSVGDGDRTGMKVYETRHDAEKTIYYFQQELGKVLVEQNIYLNINEKLVDLELKILPYELNGAEINFDPKAIYNQIKNFFYYSDSLSLTNCLETSYRGVEMHSYLKCGEDATFSYTVKNFKS